MSDTEKNTESKKKITLRQVIAMAGVILLVLLYIVTLLAAVFDNTATGKLIYISLFSTIAIPILLWIFLRIFDRMKTKTDYDPSMAEETSGEE